MKELIQAIISHSEPRPAGSPAEKKAQLYLLDKLHSISTAVSIESFEAPLTAKFGKLKYYALGYLIALVFFFFSPWSALIISLTTAVVLVCDLMLNIGIADFLFPLSTSWNVSATLEPDGEVKRTIILCAHIDSTPECRWWYWLGTSGARLTILCGLMIIGLPIFFVWIQVSDLFFPNAILANHYIYLIFLLLSPLTIIYFTFHSSVVVEGACDNLSGIAIAKEVWQHFATNDNYGHSKLAHTRLRFVSFGAEEKGLRGSKAYVSKHLASLQKENALLINVDSVRLPEQVTIITGERMAMIDYDQALVRSVAESFDVNNILYKEGILPMGGTDAASFQQEGIPSLSIIGIDMQQLDPTYHTRRDRIDQIDEQALENVKKGLIAFVSNYDIASANSNP